jgi:plasmid maintenance system antidote protein VapI
MLLPESTVLLEDGAKYRSPPGASIQDILDERSLTVAWLAEKLSISVEETTDLLQGKLAITTSLARDLEKLSFGTAAFWLVRDYKFIYNEQ